jgi:hypothetical protein
MSPSALAARRRAPVPWREREGIPMSGVEESVVSSQLAYTGWLARVCASTVNKA